MSRNDDAGSDRTGELLLITYREEEEFYTSQTTMLSPVDD